MKLEGNFKYFLNGRQISQEQYERLKPNLSITFKQDEVHCKLDVKSGSLAEAFYLDEFLKSELGETSKWYETTTGVSNKYDMRINPEAINLFKITEITPVDLFLKGESNGNESLKDILDNLTLENKTKEAKKYFEEVLSEVNKGYNKDTPIHSFQNQEGYEEVYPRYRRGRYIDYSSSKNSTNKGQKHNEGKLPMSRLFDQFPDALQAIIKCSNYGHQKYKEDVDWKNFKRVEGGSKTYADAGLRHRLQEGNDESGLPHQYHVAWNALAELQLWIEENKQ